MSESSDVPNTPDWSTRDSLHRWVAAQPGVHGALITSHNRKGVPELRIGVATRLQSTLESIGSELQRTVPKGIKVMVFPHPF